MVYRDLMGSPLWLVYRDLMRSLLVGGFKDFFVFNPTCGNDPI